MQAYIWIRWIDNRYNYIIVIAVYHSNLLFVMTTNQDQHNTTNTNTPNTPKNTRDTRFFTDIDIRPTDDYSYLAAAEMIHAVEREG